MLLMNTNIRHFTALYGYVDVAKALIQNGADVNAVQTEKETPLHYTAKHDHVDVAKSCSRTAPM